MPNCRKPGTYALLFSAKRGFSATVGALGTVRFSKGAYVYIGSALGPGGLGARLQHHLSRPNRPHWHLDYLHGRVKATAVWYSSSEERFEHDWANAIAALSGASGVSRFGSSDCDCDSHLFHFATPPQLRNFRRALKRFNPDCTSVYERVLPPQER